MRIDDDEATLNVYKSISSPSYHRDLCMIKEVIYYRYGVEKEKKIGPYGEVVVENITRILTFVLHFMVQASVFKEKMSHRSKKANIDKSYVASSSRGKEKRLAPVKVIWKRDANGCHHHDKRSNLNWEAKLILWFVNNRIMPSENDTNVSKLKDPKTMKKKGVKARKLLNRRGNRWTVYLKDGPSLVADSINPKN
ncbi:hypothetical protein HAX54_025346 [Datura stramonium]|uniref:Uncharacterized protein n=1 Tax=Datura stramonium TaxID=4076 RepID=A0ABS8S657_DATST|nr:hypothetical protein [Datura stramonium]